MKVFNLCCSNGHSFEGWFDSLEDFADQCRRGLVSCPICGSKQIEKRPSAPYIGARPAEKRSASSVSASKKSAAEAARKLEGMREQVMAYVREASKSAEDVGENFVPEVRAMHEGQKPVRTVKGVCTEKDRRDLLDDGIVVLPVPESAGKTLN